MSLSPKTSAVVSCVCGSAFLRFARSTPRLHLECACCDCRQANEWSAWLASRPPPPPLSQLYYFDNDVLEATEELLELQMLRVGARSTRCVAKCCHSVVAVDHPAYKQNVVMVPGDSCRVEAASLPGAIGRVYETDWDEHHDGQLEPFIADRDAVAAMPAGSDCQRPWRTVFSLPLEGVRQGMSLQALHAKLGPVKVLNLQEARRFAADLTGPSPL
eukprot:CAMPEP_0194538834 /NCGR_PEP_ID=MMETSP0253-20130528/78536_1 /TAXON_ID=2966 /ORGANISM="Noctiluca scintillans" /LENGTH=215 /DNA_ID=CAMNT_0039385017 /DNA_START=28 /DNA_END=675 /DNA_ORIENTATION=+